MIQDPFVAELLDMEKRWEADLAELISPRHDWDQRTVTVRHDKDKHENEPYTAILHHPKDFDHSKLERTGRIPREPLRKAVGDKEESKGEKKPIPADAQWITIFSTPDKEPGTGHPVLLEPNNDGSHTVIAGAGGKLNGLRLTGVKTPEEYRHLSAQRRKTRMDQERVKDALMRQQMTAQEYEQHKAEQEANKSRTEQNRLSAEKNFVATVAKAQGVEPSKFEVPKEELAGLEPNVVAQVQRKAHEASVQWAKQVTEAVKDKVLNAFDQTQSDAVGDIAITDLLSNRMSDTGIGYQAEMDRMAAENGLTPQKIKKESNEMRVRGFLERSDYDVEAANAKMEQNRRLQAGAANTRQEVKQASSQLAESDLGPHAIKGLPTSPQVENLGQAVEILKAHKVMQEAVKASKAEMANARDISSTKTAVVPIQEMSDKEALDAVAKSLSQESMTRAMQRIVHGTNDMEAESGTLRQHYSVGQNAALGAISQAVDGTIQDPLLVDTLGASGAANVLAARWRSSMSPQEFEAVKSALQEQHVATQEAIAKEGMDRAEDYQKQAEAIEPIPNPDTPEALDAALADHARKVELLKMARQCAGTARGRLEASAALNEAMLHTKPGSVMANLGAKSAQDGLEAAYALGLTDPSTYDEKGNIKHEGEFTLHYDAGNRILEVQPKGLAKLAQVPDPAAVRRAQVTTDIKNGKYDEPGWLPGGIISRPASLYEMDPIVAHSADHQMRVEATDDSAKLESKLRNLIGGLLDNGRDALTVAADVRSVGFREDLHLSPAQDKAFDDVLARVVPTYHDMIRSSIEASIPKDLKPGSKEYEEAYAKSREEHKSWTNTSGEGKSEFQDRYSTYRQGLVDGINKCGDSYIDSLRKSGRVKPEDAALDKQRIPLNGATQDALFRAVLQDPRTQNAFMPYSQVDKSSIRSFALEHILGVDPNKQEIVSKITPQQAQVYGKWQELRQANGAGGVYKAIQQDMLTRHTEDSAGSMFDEPSKAPSLATVDLSDDASVIAAAKENAGALGYKRQVDPETGMLEYRELIPGSTFSVDKGASAKINVTTTSPLTEYTIARVARNRIKKHLREYFVGSMLGNVDVAKSGFDPETVLTGSNRWTKYKDHMGGLNRATRAVQEVMQDHLLQRFAEVYGKQTGKKLKLAKKPLTDYERHAAATQSPEEVEAQLAKDKVEYSEVGRGKYGRWKPGERRELLANKRRLEKEGGTLLGESEKGEFKTQTTKRFTAGRAVESALRGMCPYIPVDRAVDLPSAVSMSGDGIDRQRSVKLIEANERQGVTLGVGRGKTLIGIGAFTDLHSKGKVQRGLYVVPGNVLGQFGSEFLKFTDPSAGLRWHADTKADASDRISALGDPGYHMVVTTAEALREDVTKAVAEDLGIDPKAAVTKMAAMSEDKIDELVHSAMDKRGWNFQYSMWDEASKFRSREGDKVSHMARIAGSVGRKTRYMVDSSADISRNDVSEVFSALHGIDPKRYNDSTKASFLRRYSRNTVAAKSALQKEIAPYFYTSSASTSIEQERHTHVLPIEGKQATEHAEVMKAYRAVKVARQSNDTAGLVKALKVLDPSAFHEDDTPQQEEETAKRLLPALGTLRETALNRVVNLHSSGAKLKWIDQFVNAHKGEPTVIFAHNLSSVKAIRDKLSAQGHRVASITGGMSTDAKDKAKLAFSPESGEASVDVLVCSDAAAVGANLQRGYLMCNYDSPYTSKTYEQRIGREARQGQKNKVSVHDLVADTEFDRRNRRRLEQKGALREVLSSPNELCDDSGLAERIHAARVKAFESETGAGDERKAA